MQTKICFDPRNLQIKNIPFVGVWSPDAQSLSRLETELYEARSQGLDLLLQLAEVPLDILLDDHQALPVPKLVSCHINRLNQNQTSWDGVKIKK